MPPFSNGTCESPGLLPHPSASSCSFFPFLRLAKIHFQSLIPSESDLTARIVAEQLNSCGNTEKWPWCLQANASPRLVDSQIWREGANRGCAIRFYSLPLKVVSVSSLLFSSSFLSSPLFSFLFLSFAFSYPFPTAWFLESSEIKSQTKQNSDWARFGPPESMHKSPSSNWGSSEFFLFSFGIPVIQRLSLFLSSIKYI